MNLPSPYDTSSMYSNAMAAPPNSNNNGTKQPPSYEDCIKVSWMTSKGIFYRISTNLLLPFFWQNAQSLQSLQGNGLDMIKLDNYGYSMGSPFQQELLNGQALGMGGGRGTNTMCGLGAGLPNGGHEQGLSPPYSNQSPPHSVQSSLALSPHAYLGKLCSNFAKKNVS